LLPPPETVDNGARRARVLIVDDDTATRELCKFNLQLAGMHVLEATDGHNGLVRARFERPDLVLTDVDMPGLNGFELAEALRGHERTRTIPLIFLSGESGPAHEARAVGLGALAYVKKPFDPEALAALVARALAQSSH
jgi:CheY-like chemotaxis protein